MAVEPVPPWNNLATFSRGIAGIPHVEALLGCQRLVTRPSDADAGSFDAVVAWGEKPHKNRRAVDYARRHDLALWRVEDGFLRSVGLGAEGDPPLSVVLDGDGIYYDARGPSRLERLCAQSDVDDPELVARAGAVMATIRRHRLSKYNCAPPGDLHLPATERPRVLVIDQTYGDKSVECGLADAGTFDAMLRAALAENPGAEILVKTHPDVVAGKKRGYLETVPDDPRVRVLGTPVNPIALLEHVDRAYVVTSQLGFEALVMGVPVACFGAPFYAGWGLTDDRARIERRSRDLSLEQLFAAAYILYPRYVDPDTGQPCDVERVADHLALQRDMFARNAGKVFCFGFQVWKRNYVRSYLRSPGNDVAFPRSARHARWLGFDHTSTLLVWGQRESAEVRELARRHGVAVWRMEDGFLRSVGLGSDLATPASLVVDRRGIYYDPSRASELEELLQHAEFDAGEIDRAAALRAAMIESRISKYNVGADLSVDVPPDRQVVLVPGQVEDDASVRLGCRDVRSNLALLEAARAEQSGAFIIFKPHPDVLSGNRRGSVAPRDAERLADHVETGASLPRCLAVADRVYTMTSLVGFEALLRGVDVVVFGRPFYAGWGLTDDRNPLARRTRRRTLDELVAATLIRYPRYLNRHTGRFTNPEVVVAELRRERDAIDTVSALHASWPRRAARKLVRAYKGVVDVR